MSEQAAATPDINTIKSKMKATWSAGDFGKIAEIIQVGADAFVERLNITPGETVLDVACGTGNLSIPAAQRSEGDRHRYCTQPYRAGTRPSCGRRAYMQVRGRRRRGYAVRGRLVRHRDNDVRGHVRSAAREDRSRTSALCRPGGRLVMANWTPQHFVGQMFKTGVSTSRRRQVYNRRSFGATRPQ